MILTIDLLRKWSIIPCCSFQFEHEPNLLIINTWFSSYMYLSDPTFFFYFWVHLVAGQGNRWLERTVRRGCPVPWAPAASTSGRTKQACWCAAREFYASEPDLYADEHASGQWRRSGRCTYRWLLVGVCLDEEKRWKEKLHITNFSFLHIQTTH